MNYFFNDKKLFKTEVTYIDVLDKRYCIKLLVENDIKFKIIKGYISKDNKYSVIVCEIPKKYKPKFIKVMEELRNKILICGYNDYDQFCKKILVEIIEVEK